MPSSKARISASPTFGTTEYPVTRNVLRSLGLDPDKDVKWTAVGNGIPAGVALERGAIDALAYYDTGFGQIEAAGMAFDMLPRPESCRWSAASS